MLENSPSVFDLSAAEKLQLVQDLWDDLSDADVPLLDWQKQELDRRRERWSTNPPALVDFQSVRLRARQDAP